jgi:predicted transcriptional regulator of viral defense system
MVPRVYEQFYPQRVFSVEEAAGLFPDIQQTRNALHYAKKQRYLKRIKGGLYCVVPFEYRAQESEWERYSPDLFLIGTRIVEPYAFSHCSALFIYGLTESKPNRVIITSPKRFRPFRWQEAQYVSVHTTDFFGVRTVYHKEDLPVQITDFEKTFLDCLQRFDLAGGMIPFYRALHRFGFLNPPQLVAYLDRIDSKALKVRAGFTLYQMRGKWEIPQSLLNPLLDLAAEGPPGHLDRGYPVELCELDPLWNLWVPQGFKEITKPVG